MGFQVKAIKARTECDIDLDLSVHQEKAKLDNKKK